MTQDELKYLLTSKEFKQTKDLFRSWLECESNSRPGEYQRSIGKLLDYFEEGAFNKFIDDIYLED